MPLPHDGDVLKGLSVSLHLDISKSFSSRKAAAIFVEKLQKKLSQGETWQLTTTIERGKSEDCYVSTATITYLAASSETMCKKLDALSSILQGKQTMERFHHDT
mgnify:FL=1